MTRLRSRRFRRPSFGFHSDSSAVLIVVLAVALVVRLAVAMIVPLDFRFQRDAATYVSLGRQLLVGDAYGLEPGVPDARIPPGYPLFIAGIFALTGKSRFALRMAQVALGTLMVWLTFLIGLELSDRRVGLLGAFMMALYPAWVFWISLFLSETFFTVLLLTIVWCLIRLMRSGAFRYAPFTGVLLGLAVLTREAFLAFPLLLPLATWWSRVPWRRAWRYLLFLVVAILLTVSPWMARNNAQFGHVFYTEGTEATRYRLTGNGYLSPYFQYLADESIPPPPDKTDEYFDRYGRASDMMRIDRLLTEPATYLRHLVNRGMELWLHPNGLVSLPDIGIVRALYIFVHIILLGLAGLGIVAGLRRRNLTTGILTLVLAYFTGMSLFFSNPLPRYTLPVLPVVFVLTAMGLGLVWQRLQRKTDIPGPS